MPRHNFPTFLLSAVIVTLSVVFPSPAFCRLNLPEIEGQTVIEGQEHQILEDFFARFRQEDIQRPPGGEVKRILLKALPEAYKNGCTDMVAHWGPAADGTETLSVKVLHVEGGIRKGPSGRSSRMHVFQEQKNTSTVSGTSGWLHLSLTATRPASR